VDYAYNDFATKPDPSHRPLFAAHVQRLLAELPDGAKVLDAGCGGGDFSLALTRFDIYGCDLNETALPFADARGIGTFKRASLYDNLVEPFGVEAFDAIVAIEVIEHLYSPQRFLERAHEALRPGGLLIVSTPYWGYFKNVALALTDRMDRLFTVEWEGGHIKHFSRRSLTGMAQRRGFEPVEFIGTGETLRQRIPGLWSAMLVAFRKPD
jgi:2-polyprenyl-3-methyl-5-hydroxy-6-metoxy-1,4-benzoquinol methylase